MPEVVLATQNPGKIAELRSLLAPLGCEVLGLADVGDLPPEPEETGSTFEANATIKALAYAEATGRLCLADDSGLIVDALGGRPGVISSHFAFDGRTDGEAAMLSREERDHRNNARLLAELEGIPPEQRTARFVCVMALAGAPLLSSSSHGAEGFQPSDRATPDAGLVKRSGGRLPHWDVPGGTYFLTFRAEPGIVFSEQERKTILDACLHGHPNRYTLHTACVMPDHVHLLLRTERQPDGRYPQGFEIVHSIKSFTANRLNKARERNGAVWQREYFDRLIRTAAEGDETDRYIQQNPVRAGLVEKAMDYPFVWRGDIGLRPIGGLEAPRSSKEKAPAVLATTTGAFEGRIGLPGEVPRGAGGFGYDPLFLVGPDFKRTGAELDKSEKNRLSHRGAAVRAMMEELTAMMRV
jgi:non-canonical purine NTP pyrophosphatase (RdgB/HAM1 family)